MAAKKSSKPKFGAKTAFVKSVPASTPAAEVVALAAKKGIKLTTGLVYNIRSVSKSSGSPKNKAKPGPKPRSTKGRRGGRPSAGGSAETQLRAAIAAIGLTAARRILDEVEATFAGR